MTCKFAKYKSYNGALREHAKLLKRRFKPKKNTINAWAKSLQKGGYATDSNYAKKLKGVIKYWGLK